jgi:hypothetical protein
VEGEDAGLDDGLRWENGLALQYLLPENYLLHLPRFDLKPRRGHGENLFFPLKITVFRVIEDCAEFLIDRDPRGPYPLLVRSRTDTQCGFPTCSRASLETGNSTKLFYCSHAVISIIPRGPSAAIRWRNKALSEIRFSGRLLTDHRYYGGTIWLMLKTQTGPFSSPGAA